MNISQMAPEAVITRRDRIMSAMAMSWIVFACVFAGALLGMYLRTALPAHHL